MNARLIALAVALVLVAGLGLAVAQWGPRRAAAPKPAATVVPDTAMATDQAIQQALASAPIDSVALKSEWHDEVRGLEYDDLSPAQRTLFLRFANAERCTCGCGYTLAGCLASDMTCDISRPRAQALLDSVRAGQVRAVRGLRAAPPAAR